MALSKEQILAADDIKTEAVNVPEWGGEVLLKRLTGKERDEFEDGMYKTRGKKRELNTANFRARLCSICIVDERGKPMFTPAEVTQLGEKSAMALGRVVRKAMAMNGFDETDEEELTKNS